MAKRKEVHFGQLAIVLGYVTPASVAECLKLQKMLSQKGVKKHLGRILLEQQVLTEEQFKNILKKQGVVRFRCTKCNAESAVEESTGEHLFQCAECGGTLTASVEKTAPALAAGKEDPLINQVLAGARIISRLRDDNFTRMYKGVQETQQREVLVRVLKDEFASDPETVKRFMTRASRAAKVKHGSVAAVYDVKEEKGLYYTIEELVEGTSLSRLLYEEKNLSPRQAARIAMQIAHALKTIHARKAVHGNISTSNIMVNRMGRAVLIGLSAGPSLLSSEEAFKKTHAISPEFAAPEVVKDAARATPRSDIFSLGAVLYRMIVGAGPFIGESDFEIMLSSLSGKYRKLDEIAPKLPEQLSAMLDKMLKRNPMMRYENMIQLVAAFEELDVSKIPQERVPVPEDMIIARAPEEPGGAEPPPMVPEPAAPEQAPPAPAPELEPAAPEKEEPIKLADQAPETPELAPPEPIAVTPEPEDEIVPAAPETAPEPEPALMPEEATKAPRRRKKRAAPVDLPEVVAFLEDESAEVELTQREKQEILEEGLAQEEEVLPPPEVLEAMAARGKKKGRPLPIIVAAVVIVVLVIIFMLVFSMPADKEETGESAAELQYNQLIDFASRNPDNLDEQIEKFRVFVRKYPSTRWATKARVKVAQLEEQLKGAKQDEEWSVVLKKVEESSGDAARQAQILRGYIESHPSSPYVEEARRRIAGLESDELRKQAAVYVTKAGQKIADLCEEERFKEALRFIDDGLPAGLPREPYERRLHALKNIVYEKARKSFERATDRASRLAREGKVGEAVSLLENIIRDFGIEDYALKARSVRADILNSQFEREELACAAYYGAAQAANGLAAQGRYDEALSVLNTVVADYRLSGKYREKVSQSARWIEAAREFVSYAHKHLSASVGKFISLRTTSGIVYQGTLKKFERGMLTIGELPPVAVTELPRSEIVSLARRGAGAGGAQARFQEAAYHYFSGDFEAAKGSLSGPARDTDGGALFAELRRIELARRLTRNERLFDTRSLKGWKGDVKKGWKVENGLLVATKGRIVANAPPTGDYTFTMNLLLASGGRGIDIIFPAGAGTLTWHLGTEAEGYSEVKESPATRNTTVLLESVWVRVTLKVSGGTAEGLVNGKAAWKIDPVSDVSGTEPVLGFKVSDSVFKFGRIFLKEAG